MSILAFTQIKFIEVIYKFKYVTEFRFKLNEYESD